MGSALHQNSKNNISGNSDKGAGQYFDPFWSTADNGFGTNYRLQMDQSEYLLHKRDIFYGYKTFSEWIKILTIGVHEGPTF